MTWKRVVTLSLTLALPATAAHAQTQAQTPQAQAGPANALPGAPMVVPIQRGQAGPAGAAPHGQPDPASSGPGLTAVADGNAPPIASGARAVPRASAAPGADTKVPTEKTYATCIERIAEGKKPPELKESFPKSGLSGHAATLEVVVTHLKGEEVLPGGFHITDGDSRKALESAQFYLPDPKGEAAPMVERDKGGTSTTVKVTLVPLPKEAGRQTLELPPLPITVARANGEVITLCTEPHELVLEDPIANTPDPKPKPNPPPRRQLEEWVLLEQLVIGGLLALVVGLFVAWAFTRWRRRPRPPKPGPPPRPPWEVALEELHDIRHAGLIKSHRYSEHFDRVSDTIRKYLGDRYDFDGLESTTREALTLLGALPMPPEPFEKVKAFLRQADLVKFANLTPTEEECELALARGEDIVRATRPAQVAKPSQKDGTDSETVDGGTS